MPEFECGEVVRMISDIAEAYQLQQGHGEWNDDMALVGDLCVIRLVCPVCVLYVVCVLVFLSLLPTCNSNTSSVLFMCISKLMFITGRL